MEHIIIEEKLNTIVKDIEEKLNDAHSLTTDSGFTIKKFNTAFDDICDAVDLIDEYSKLSVLEYKIESTTYNIICLLTTISLILANIGAFLLNPILGFLTSILLIGFTNKIFRMIKNRTIHDNSEYIDTIYTLIEQARTQEDNLKRKSLTLMNVDLKKMKEEEKEKITSSIISFAISIISDYIEGYDISLEDVSEDIKGVIKSVLIKDLGLDESYSTTELLQIARKKRNENNIVLEREK